MTTTETEVKMGLRSAMRDLQKHWFTEHLVTVQGSPYGKTNLTHRLRKRGMQLCESRVPQFVVPIFTF